MKTDPQKDVLSSSLVDPLTATIDEPPAVAKIPGHWSVLRNRNYSLLFWGQLISAAGTQMQVVAVAWQVYLLTHSVVALGLIGLMQAIPRLIFSLVGGVLADVLDRRKMLIVVNLTMMLFSFILAIGTHFQFITIDI